MDMLNRTLKNSNFFQMMQCIQTLHLPVGFFLAVAYLILMLRNIGKECQVIQPHYIR